MAAYVPVGTGFLFGLAGCRTTGQLAEAAWRSVGKGFSLVDRGPMPLKGFDEPVSIFEVAWQPT